MSRRLVPIRTPPKVLHTDSKLSQGDIVCRTYSTHWVKEASFAGEIWKEVRSLRQAHFRWTLCL
ncbi:hypothetical protein CROQUDRAFT_93148 [Cronartium quercuum f. sp. fusiforme G11]|uniref:Uncharacterized protein n=1 Tax=Cronartium quercuum f. sp. fusiforme G11 TaxID=708437 RepID=A0A9P6TBX6_9BASI|nr:hypothetical protein CROQUDRAFT_93148 [Cronartium quercuum f. sp. fusiforme G11]